MTLTHIAPFVRISRDKIRDKFSKYPIDNSLREQIIEDELKIRFLLRDYLKTEGFNVLEASDGDQGLFVFKNIAKNKSLC